MSGGLGVEIPQDLSEIRLISEPRLPLFPVLALSKGPLATTHVVFDKHVTQTRKY